MKQLFNFDGAKYLYYCDDYLPKNIKKLLNQWEETVEARDKYSLDYYYDPEIDSKIYCNDEYKALRELEMYYFGILADYTFENKDFILANYLIDK